MKYKVTLNGKTYEVEVEAGEAMLVDEYEAYAPAPVAAPAPAAAPAAPAAAPAPAAAAPAAPVAVGAGEPVTSPMPGNILDIRVAQGDAVKSGQVLIILEAMKMENEIVAPRDGVVNQIVTSKGATVDTGATLIVLG
ncbi:MAG: biotin/lipoyl-binding protein [Clostridiaceae bacterium]|nr:biotin/lipoyl-binding protein [Clostridiaceae bacterium]